MIYTIKYPNSRAIVDTDRIAKKFLSGGQLFVRFFAREDRIRLIEFLEKEGYHCAENCSYSRQGTIDSAIPVVVELDRKIIYHMSNVTCSAAAAKTGVIMSDRDFYLLYSLYSIAGRGTDEREKETKTV